MVVGRRLQSFPYVRMKRFASGDPGLICRAARMYMDQRQIKNTAQILANAQQASSAERLPENANPTIRGRTKKMNGPLSAGRTMLRSTHLVMACESLIDLIPVNSGFMAEIAGQSHVQNGVAS